MKKFLYWLKEHGFEVFITSCCLFVIIACAVSCYDWQGNHISIYDGSKTTKSEVGQYVNI